MQKNEWNLSGLSGVSNGIHMIFFKNDKSFSDFIKDFQKDIDNKFIFTIDIDNENVDEDIEIKSNL